MKIEPWIEIPERILAAAHQVANWAKEQGWKGWQLGPVADRNLVLTWIRTKDRKPTKKDGDEWGHVLVVDNDRPTDVCLWNLVAARKGEEIWPFWMKIPPVPDVDYDPTVSGENQ